MELFEYIKSQLPQMPNSAIMKQMGASEELIDYVKKTPWNTNLNVIGSIAGSGGGGDTGEVWLVGNNPDEYGVYTLSNVGETDHINELYEHAENYKVFLNGEELAVFSDTREEDYEVDWYDSDPDVDPVQNVSIYLSSTEPGVTLIEATACWFDVSTRPTSVEVSVKAK